MKQAAATGRIDNDRVIVTEWRFEPGEETGHHVHAMDYVVVPLTDGVLSIGGVETTMHAGEAYARPAGVVHNVINAGSEPLRFVEIELKPR